MKFEITNELLTGNTLIDTQHKELINIVNNLLDACANGEGRAKIAQTLDFLEQYVAKHFADEEKLQSDSNYPELLTHSNFHKKFKADFAVTAKMLKEEGATIRLLSQTNLMISKLITHIRTDDKKIAIHIKQA